MTHPQEAVEAVARALASSDGFSLERYTEIGGIAARAADSAREAATALLDQIAPLYREQAARVLSDRAGAIRAREADYLTWGGPDPRGNQARNMAIVLADEFDVIAAAIRKGE